MFDVIGLLGVNEGIATTVVNIVMGASTTIAVVAGILAVLTGGLTAILDIGVTVFIQTVKKLGRKKAIPY
ncbi:MAG: uberolysin/carnocyclin family circular bacteriocin [Lactobacillales bacterium]|jgi:circularin A/uberolysin family circular bacteriocin|nr:uberolysin/carnocyclin family circular bacteriocin [Lactobacillales bacterium]